MMTAKLAIRPLAGRVRPYVGRKLDGSLTVIHSDVQPTEETHGDRFNLIVGPFKTVRGARYMVEHRGIDLSSPEECDELAAKG